MGRLARLLGTDEARLDAALEQIHRSLDGGAHDTSVMGDIAAILSRLTRSFGLDPADTTPEELYMSLRRRIKDDNVRLAGALGVSDADNPQIASPRIVAWARHHFTGEYMVIKQSSLKELLSKNPPKQVMKLLHYRSTPSLLKHETASQLIVLARYIEDDAWLARYREGLTTLTRQDFELRPLEIVWFDKAVLAEALSRTEHRHHLVLHAKEVGCVGIAATSKTRSKGYVIRTLSLVHHYVHEIRYFSTLTKVLLSRGDFITAYVHALVDDHEAHIELARYPLHWRSLHAAVHGAQIHDVFPPHIDRDDWHTVSTNDVLGQLNQHIVGWGSSGYVLSGEPVVSCNIIDLTIDEEHGAAFGGHSTKYGRRSLEQEVFRRYLQEPRIHTVILKRLGI